MRRRCLFEAVDFTVIKWTMILQKLFLYVYLIIEKFSCCETYYILSKFTCLKLVLGFYPTFFVCSCSVFMLLCWMLVSLFTSSEPSVLTSWIFIYWGMLANVCCLNIFQNSPILKALGESFPYLTKGESVKGWKIFLFTSLAIWKIFTSWVQGLCFGLMEDIYEGGVAN